MRRGRSPNDARRVVSIPVEPKSITDFKIKTNSELVDARYALLKRKSALEKDKQKRLKKDLNPTRIITSQPNFSITSTKSLPLDFGSFLSFDEYKCSCSKPIKVCHVIESYGVGGAQVMMLEMATALNKYYGSSIINILIQVVRKLPERNDNTRFDSRIHDSYEVSPRKIGYSDINKFCVQEAIDIVVHHRICNSANLKSDLPDNVKYVLINHTWNNMERVKNFAQCDVIVQVCKFLHKVTPLPVGFHPSRNIVILNGIENDYIKNIEPKFNHEDSFVTGRCHRLVGGKYKEDSLHWMAKSVRKYISNFEHHLIGNHKESKAICEKYKFLHYYGLIDNKYVKMSILKSLNLYFYETYQHEGASMAILEALACGVPVICKPYGGNIELIRDGYNGFLAQDRSVFLSKMKDLHFYPDRLRSMRDNVVIDFNNRLHIRHMVCKYMQCFERLIK